MASNEIEPLWTVKDVARFLNIAEKTVRNKVSLGQMPHVKIDGSLRFKPEVIRRIVEESSVEAVA